MGASYSPRMPDLEPKQRRWRGRRSLLDVIGTRWNVPKYLATQGSVFSRIHAHSPEAMHSQDFQGLPWNGS
jgi:hypothetical protein